MTSLSCIARNSGASRHTLFAARATAATAQSRPSFRHPLTYVSDAGLGLQASRCGEAA